MNKIIKAKEFAKKAHTSIGQVRKYTNEPYFVHCEHVATLVSQVTDDEDMICAAFLHDTVEDTPTTIEDIQKEFGSRVAQFVSELTDVSKPSDGNRAIRKAIDRNHTANASAEAQTIKLADLIDNTDTITKYDADFAKVYMKEKEELLKVLTRGHRNLWNVANAIVEDYKEKKDYVSRL